MNEDRRPKAATAPAETTPPAKDRIAEIKAGKRPDGEPSDAPREEALDPPEQSD